MPGQGLPQAGHVPFTATAVPLLQTNFYDLDASRVSLDVLNEVLSRLGHPKKMQDPPEYAYYYRHWRDLLLREQGVDEDENEAHIFDLDQNALDAIKLLHDYTTHSEFLEERKHTNGVISDAEWKDILSTWPAATRRGVPTEAVFDDVFEWIPRAESASFPVRERQKYCQDEELYPPVKPARSLQDVLISMTKECNSDEVIDLLRRSEQHRQLFHSDNREFVETWTPKQFSVYLTPWKPSSATNKDNAQWRVFVPPAPPDALMTHPMKVSAITQKHIRRPYSPGKSRKELIPLFKDVVRQIVNRCQPAIEAHLMKDFGTKDDELDLVRRQLHKFGLVYDVVETNGAGPMQLRIVDIKPFGGSSHTRSGLFSWLAHCELLYGKVDSLFLMYVDASISAVREIRIPAPLKHVAQALGDTTAGRSEESQDRSPFEQSAAPRMRRDAN